MRALNSFSWVVLFYTIAVILWGAVVRITGSGAGCGSHWPTCNGEVIPLSPSTQTIIEFTHRLTSGLSLVLVVALLVWLFRALPKGHRGRSAGVGSFVFIVIEALVGAVLVLLELVGNNDSGVRALVIALHQANTFLLLGSLSLVCCVTLSRSQSPIRNEPVWGKSKVLVAILGFMALCLTAATGAVVALGDALFPATDLLSGIAADFHPESHFLIRLRIWHPIVATITAFGVVWISRLSVRKSNTRITDTCHSLVVFFVILQMTLGVMNLLLMAPMWLQISHLAVADLLLITYCVQQGDQLWFATPLTVKAAKKPVYHFDVPQVSSES